MCQIVVCFGPTIMRRLRVVDVSKIICYIVPSAIPEEGLSVMKIQTFSIVTGSEACNARCPFCISKMTAPQGVTLKEPEVNWRNFRKACQLAKLSGVTTAMLTGKGEPTLFPDQITKYLEELQPYDFPFIELQTNGIRLSDFMGYVGGSLLYRWHDLGLTTIAISIVHHEAEANRRIYTPSRHHYIDLPVLVSLLHQIRSGFSVRLACIMIKNCIDRPEALQKLIAFAKGHGVEQLKISPVNKPDFDRNQDPAAWDWTKENHVTPDQVKAITDFLEKRGTLVMTLMHGAKVYDVGGQNVCLSECLTKDGSSSDLRQLIFFPDGHLRYDWQYPGAILL